MWVVLVDHFPMHTTVPIDKIFSPDVLGSRWRVPLSHTDTPHHVLVTYRDEFDKQRSY